MRYTRDPERIFPAPARIGNRFSPGSTLRCDLLVRDSAFRRACASWPFRTSEKH